MKKLLVVFCPICDTSPLMKSFFLPILSAAIFLAAIHASGGITESNDLLGGCRVYSVTVENKFDSGKETLIYDGYVSGFNLRNLRVDFDTRLVYVDLEGVVRLGFNQFPAGRRTWISPKQENFQALLNSVNRSIFFFNKACVTPFGQILWMKYE